MKRDPIFAAMERYLRAEKRADGDRVARERLAETAPTTLDGLAAFAHFLNHQSSVILKDAFFDNDREHLAFYASLDRALAHCPRQPIEDQDDGCASRTRVRAGDTPGVNPMTQSRSLSLTRRAVVSSSVASTAAAIATIPAFAANSGAGADPIFAALDAWRSAKEEHDAAFRAVDWNDEDRSGPAGPGWEGYDAAIAREEQARYAVCRVTPTTALGAAAFARFLAGAILFDEVEFGYYGAEEAAKQALGNLDRGLTDIAARASAGS
jgi:hypothetical protein